MQLKNLLYVAGMIMFFCSCQDMPVGYLDTANAKYDPDSLRVKLTLDTTAPHEKEVPNPYWQSYLDNGYTEEQLIKWGIFPTIKVMVEGEDYQRFQQKIPWVSYMIQGVEGTRPINYRLVGAIKKGGGDVKELLNHARVRGDGAVEIDLENKIEAGEYFLDVEVSNEGYTAVLPKVIRIIVK